MKTALNLQELLPLITHENYKIFVQSDLNLITGQTALYKKGA